jgi:hypothetical protein
MRGTALVDVGSSSASSSSRSLAHPSRPVLRSLLSYRSRRRTMPASGWALLRVTGAIRHVFIWQAERGTPVAERIAIVVTDMPNDIVIPSRSEHGPFLPLDKAETDARIALMEKA